MAKSYKYPRRKILRVIMHQMSIWAFKIVSDLTIIGEENIPAKGPLLVVGNHFSFIDPVCFVRLARWPIDFIGADQPAFAPTWAHWIINTWGYHHVFRGTGSTEALRASEAILSQNGVLGIFPEGGSWAKMLRPARPGTAYLAARTGASILPVGLYGFNEIFPLRFRDQAKATIKIGKPFGPFKVIGRGRERRRQLDQIGNSIMQEIALLLPDELRGKYSEDHNVRLAAKEAEHYPWADKIEGEVFGEPR
ncbi:MAG: 1-acyl-sn-glycerol-3-phosphate acyltransferase [Chloroflexi bacterium]|nr:1-acyl-sn-glycerol-3-phosphate acyltransferase [Chloroflexota bacterium]